MGHGMEGKKMIGGKEKGEMTKRVKGMER